MKVPVDLLQQQPDAFDELGEQQGRSRASLIREAVTDYLERQPRSLGESFGLWRTQRGEPEDGAAYQRRLRSEWE